MHLQLLQAQSGLQRLQEPKRIANASTTILPLTFILLINLKSAGAYFISIHVVIVRNANEKNVIFLIPIGEVGLIFASWTH